jgi:hypothetical protein
MAELDLKDRQIPAHRSRLDFSLLGAKITEGDLHIAGRCDRGRMCGKKLDARFDDRERLRQFTDVAGVPRAVNSLPGYAEYLNAEGAEIRYSAVVLKSIERWIEGMCKWVPVDSPPDEECRFRFLYELTDFERPQGETDLHLTENFHDRRKRIERKRSDN